MAPTSTGEVVRDLEARGAVSGAMPPLLLMVDDLAHGVGGTLASDLHRWIDGVAERVRDRDRDQYGRGFGPERHRQHDDVLGGHQARVQARRLVGRCRHPASVALHVVDGGLARLPSVLVQPARPGAPDVVRRDVLDPLVAAEHDGVAQADRPGEVMAVEHP
ncbi:MAG TPA: hypothetical protein VHN80_05485, partial [Kineosporiaceae bacterium]|nr:hypothetical protein [Kineosporiaceae bacterium]